MRKKLALLTASILMSLFLGACQISVQEIAEQATPIAAREAASQATSTPPVIPTVTATSLPTDTPTLTPTNISPVSDDPNPEPADTHTPTPTPVETSTNTPTAIPPTSTPLPTATPAPPTNTPTSVPPSPTPAPVKPAAETHYEQGSAYLTQQQWNEAIAEFTEALRLDPSFAQAYAGLGYSYARQGDLEAAIANLEQYLQLLPANADPSQVEADIAQMREQLAQASSDFDIPPGKALFVFVNYTDLDWNVDVGPYFLQVPAKTGQEDVIVTLIIDPGTYSWQAHSPGGGYYITDEQDNKYFEFTVAAGELFPVRVR